MHNGMQSPQEVDKLIEMFKRERHKRVGIAVTDLDGVLLSKYINLEKFASIAKHGGSWCDCIFGWDIADKLYDHLPGCRGCHPGYPDQKYRVDIGSMRRVPDENKMPLFIAEFCLEDSHELYPTCPRCVLRRVLNRAAEMGLGVKLAFEYEFFLFEETPDSIREKDYKNPKPFSPGMFGYSALRTATHSSLFHDFMDYCIAMDMSLEQVHNETGPGVMEASIYYDDAMQGADKAVLFKTFSKVFFQKRNIMPTFMAKWNIKLPGQSGHLHHSVYDLRTGAPSFYDQEQASHMSKVLSHFLAGQLKLLKPFLVLFCPTINSYRRLVKGSWAPTSVTWGMDNRTTAVRVVPGGPAAQRLEHRMPAADGNPYLVAAAVIASGLYGIEHELMPGEPIPGNVYDIEDDFPAQKQLPKTLREAATLLSESKEAKEYFGGEFVEHFATSRMWEVSEYEAWAKAQPGDDDSGEVSNWELSRYFELI